MTHLLPYLANPNFALATLLLGILLIYAEFNLPGAVLPGSLGALLTMLALFGLTRLALAPLAIAIAAAGVALLLISLRFLRAPSIAALHRDGREPRRPISGLILAVISTSTIIYGLATLNPSVHPAVAIATGTIFSTVTLWLGRIALLARDNKRIPHPRTTSINASTQSTGVDC